MAKSNFFGASGLPVHLKSDQRLDLSDDVIPFSLAHCKAAMAQLAPGKVLEIRLSDYETLQDLLIIVERSGDRVLAWERQAGHCSLWVEKCSGK